MLKANLTAVDALDFRRLIALPSKAPPPTGLLKHFHNWMRFQAFGLENPAELKTAAID